MIAAGAQVAWDATANQIDLPGTGLYPVGIATEPAGDGRRHGAGAVGRRGDRGGGVTVTS